MSNGSPSRFSDKFMVRLPDGMREQLATAARRNRRSMNAELVVHLEAGLVLQDTGPVPAQADHIVTLGR